jgi:hypothetical protein
MKDWAKKDPKFCAQIHEELTKLVTLAKEVGYEKKRVKIFFCISPIGKNRVILFMYNTYFFSMYTVLTLTLYSMYNSKKIGWLGLGVLLKWLAYMSPGTHVILVLGFYFEFDRILRGLIRC